MRKCQAIITVSTGRQGSVQFPVVGVEQYTTTQSIDNDADQFSIDVSDTADKLGLCLDRDNEVQVQLFLSDMRGNLSPVFNGIADAPSRGEDFTLTMSGRDTPSSLSIDTDALPGRWKHVDPASFIKKRAVVLGLTQIQAAKMSSINLIYTDGSEKEWAFWYRMARMKGMYMWSDNMGRLLIDKLGYAPTPVYKFGVPPRGESTRTWYPINAVNQLSNKGQRVRKVVVYAENAKAGKALIAQSVDTAIASWRRKPVTIFSDPTAKKQADAKKVADTEIFESIVGAQEIELTIHEPMTLAGATILIQQNKMALVNLPEYGISMELWFIVGVQRQGGPEGLTQIVRLREKGFALTKRVPDAPALKDPKDLAANKPIGSIAAQLGQIPGIKWADSFVRASQEFGVANGWDLAVFLGVLLSMCAQETNFLNEREGGHGVEWQPYEEWVNSGDRLDSGKNYSQLELDYQRLYANSGNNPLNPYRGRSNAEAGVGPMQLTSLGYKQWADQYGWNGKAKSNEYDGGRWNPDSNIRAAARALIDKLKASPPADPTNPDTIWIGVARYNGSQVYADKVRAKYKALYRDEAAGAIAAVKSLPPGSTDVSITIPGYGVLTLPESAPAEVRKAINFALRRLGDPYEFGGAGPHYDCSSFVTAALASAAQYLRAALDEPVASPKRHGESTYTLWVKGKKVAKDQLLPGDLVFFRGNPPEHLGMYLDDGLFIHDPHAGDYVKISSLNTDYYRENYSGGRRFVTTWYTSAGGPR